MSTALNSRLWLLYPEGTHSCLWEQTCLGAREWKAWVLFPALPVTCLLAVGKFPHPFCVLPSSTTSPSVTGLGAVQQPAS